MDCGVDSHDQRGTTPIVVVLLMCLSFGHRFQDAVAQKHVFDVVISLLSHYGEDMQ